MRYIVVPQSSVVAEGSEVPDGLVVAFDRALLDTKALRPSVMGGHIQTTRKPMPCLQRHGVVVGNAQARANSCAGEHRKGRISQAARYGRRPHQALEGNRSCRVEGIWNLI